MRSPVIVETKPVSAATARLTKKYLLAVDRMLGAAEDALLAKEALRREFVKQVAAMKKAKT